MDKKSLEPNKETLKENYKETRHVIFEGLKQDSARLDVVQYLSAMSGIYLIIQFADMNLCTNKLAVLLLIISIIVQTVSFILVKKKAVKAFNDYQMLSFYLDFDDYDEHKKLLEQMKKVNTIDFFPWLQLAFFIIAIGLVAIEYINFGN